MDKLNILIGRARVIHLIELMSVADVKPHRARYAAMAATTAIQKNRISQLILTDPISVNSRGGGEVVKGRPPRSQHNELSRHCQFRDTGFPNLNPSNQRNEI